MLCKDLGIWECNSSPPAYRHTQTIWVFWDAGSPRTDRRRPSRTARQINRKMGFIWRLCLCQIGCRWLKWSPRLAALEKRRERKPRREEGWLQRSHADARTHSAKHSHNVSLSPGLWPAHGIGQVCQLCLPSHPSPMHLPSRNRNFCLKHTLVKPILWLCST